MNYTYGGYDHANGRNEYKITESGTAYSLDTPDDLVLILERLRETQQRIILDYGDVKTGKSWGEEYDIAGRIGRSNGQFKIPILLYSSRSWGGGAILTDCILGIKASAGKQQIYKLKLEVTA